MLNVFLETLPWDLPREILPGFCCFFFFFFFDMWDFSVSNPPWCWNFKGREMRQRTAREKVTASRVSGRFLPMDIHSPSVTHNQKITSVENGYWRGKDGQAWNQVQAWQAEGYKTFFFFLPLEANINLLYDANPSFPEKCFDNNSPGE